MGRIKHICTLQFYPPTEERENTKKDELYAQFTTTINEI